MHCRCSINETDEQISQCQTYSSSRCTWNQRLIFSDIATLDNLNLTIKLFDDNDQNLGQVAIPLNDCLSHSSNWYRLEPVKNPPTPTHRVLPTVQSQDPMIDR